MSRVAIYRRVSRDREGREISVDVQEARCRKNLVNPDDQVVSVFTDNDIGASTRSKKRRPGYEALLADAKAGKIDVVAAYSTSRLTRRVRERLDLVDLAVEHKIEFRYVKSPSFDLNTATGRKFAVQTAADDQEEAELTSERVKEIFGEKRERGEDHGGPRLFGYQRVDGHLVIDPTEAAAIALAARDVLAGVSLSSIARRWNDAGLTPPIAAKFGPVSVRGVLRRPASAGLLTHEGEIIGRGNWKPLIDEPTWRALVLKLHVPSRQLHNGTSPRWLGSGLYLCGRCHPPLLTAGSTMRANVNGGQPSYRCRSRDGHLTIKAVPVDEFVREVIAGFLRKRGADLLAKDRAEELAAAGAELAAARAEHEALADSGVSVALAAKKEPAILARIDAALELVAQLGAGSSLAGVADAPDPGAAFLARDVERQRAVVRAVAEVVILPGRAIAHERVRVDWL